MIIDIAGTKMECTPIEWIQYMTLMGIQEQLFSGKLNREQAQMQLDFAILLGPYVNQK